MANIPISPGQTITHPPPHLFDPHSNTGNWLCTLIPTDPYFKKVQVTEILNISYDHISKQYNIQLGAPVVEPILTISRSYDFLCLITLVK